MGALQQGTAGAGVASPEDSTWTLLNPATLVDLDRRVDVIHQLFFLKVSSHPQGSPLASNPFAGSMKYSSLIHIPAIGITAPLEKGVLGFGIFGISGNELDFPHPRATLALLDNADRRSSYEVVRMPLAYARRITEHLAIGGAIVPVASRFRTDSITLRFRPAKADYDWDVAFGMGFEAGVYYQRPKWSAAASYTSRTWMGKYTKYSKDALPYNVDLPQKVQLGIALRPRKDLEFLLDYKWVNWTRSGLWGPPNLQGGLGWEDQHIMKAGVRWQATNRLRIHLGAAQGNSPVPEESVFFNALGPGISSTHLAAGMSVELTDRSSVHVAITHVPTKTLRDSGQGDLFSRLGRGTEIGYGENSLTMQLSHRF